MLNKIQQSCHSQKTEYGGQRNSRNFLSDEYPEGLTSTKICIFLVVEKPNANQPLKSVKPMFNFSPVTFLDSVILLQAEK